jgi:hypothetical protein
VLAGLLRRRPRHDADRAHAVRHAEIRRLALALRDAGHVLRSNRAQLAAIVEDVVPGLTARPGVFLGTRVRRDGSELTITMPVNGEPALASTVEGLVA